MKMNLQNALLIGFSVGCLFLTKAVCEDLQVNYTVSYDQVVSTFWYNAITQPDAQVECKVPLLEDNHLKNGARNIPQGADGGIKLVGSPVN
jgi:hypothetical protein